MKHPVSIYELQLYAAHVTFQQLANSEFISARADCHLCEKVANFDDRNQSNFGGFDNMNQWFVKRDADKIRNNAYIWKECNTEDARKNHVSETFVRWSEIYQLLYFDPTKFLIVDPMHCLFVN